MNKCMMIAAISFAAGMYVGYRNEDELEEMCRQGRRTKKKAMRRMHKAYDSVCDCMDMD